jgi:hypothetical protein
MTTDTNQTALYRLEAAVQDALQALRTAAIIADCHLLPGSLESSFNALLDSAESLAQRIATAINQTEA